MKALLNQTFDRELAIAEIQKRNQLRKQAQLPPVNIDKELAILEKVVVGNDFYNFVAENENIEKRFAEKNLKRMRKMFRDPDWKPRGVISNWGFYSHVNDRMRRVYKFRVSRLSRIEET